MATTGLVLRGGATVLPGFLPTPTPTHPVLSCPEPGAVKNLGAAQYRIPQGGPGQSGCRSPQHRRPAREPPPPPRLHGPLPRTSPHSRLLSPMLTHARMHTMHRGPTALLAGRGKYHHLWACKLRPFLESTGGTGSKNHQGEWKPEVGGAVCRAPGARDSPVLSLSLRVGLAQARQTQLPSLVPCPHLPGPHCLVARATSLLRLPSTVTHPSVFSTLYVCTS